MKAGFRFPGPRLPSPKSHTRRTKCLPSGKITPAPTPTVPAARICRTEGCTRTVSYNNASGICSEHQRQGSNSKKKRTNGHNGVQHRELKGAIEHKAPRPAKTNGADHQDHTNGNGAQSAEQPIGLLVMPRAESSRVDLLLAAIPRADKEKMLSAWLAGTF